MNTDVNTIHYDVIVIGAGQAGLATGYYLNRAGVNYLILNASTEPTGAWPRYRPSLTLVSPINYSSLPGLPFPGEPTKYPTRNQVIDYRHAACLSKAITMISGCSVPPLPGLQIPTFVLLSSMNSHLFVCCAAKDCRTPYKIADIHITENAPPDGHHLLSGTIPPSQSIAWPRTILNPLLVRVINHCAAEYLRGY